MKRNKILMFIVLIGLIVRIVLIIKLPMWIDERDSISYIQLPVNILFSGIVNVTHPPGYFLLLKAWSLIIHSISITGLRLSTLAFFLLNCAFIYRLGTRYLTKRFGMMVLLSYCLSGYSVIFDWQIRPYTGLTTFILTSLYLLTFSKSKTALVLFSIINFIGLFFDYGFIWYAGSLIVLLSLFMSVGGLRNIFDRKNAFILSLILGVLAYAIVWIPHGHLESGLQGMAWIRFYTGPSFFVPFFLGAAHQWMPLAAIMFLLFAIGCILLRQIKHSFLRLPPVILAGISLYSAFCINAFIPILHVRNLQIVGIGVIFIFAIVFYWLAEKKKYALLFAGIFIYSANFFLIIQTHFLYPGKLLIKFLP